MSSDPPMLDCRSRPKDRNRPVRLLSHAWTAAMLCLITIAFSIAHGAFARDPDRVVWVELLLVLYGLIATAMSIALGRLDRSDKAWLWGCGAVYLLTLAWAVLTPSINR